MSNSNFARPEPSQQVCPKAAGNLTHHFMPRRHGNVGVMTCIYCLKTEKEIREEQRDQH